MAIMVGVFGRSLSFPNKNPNRPSSNKPPLSRHARSVSLPCRSHPLIFHLKDEISRLRTWAAACKSESPTSAWLCDGLSRLRNVHDSLDDFLLLPQTQESLSRQPFFVDKLLEDFLRFVDVYGIFQTSLLSFKEAQSLAHAGMRKRDETKVVSYVKALKKMAKEMNKLVSTVRSVISDHGDDADDENVKVINEVTEATILVSNALFNGISLSSSSFSSRSNNYHYKSSWKMMKLTKKTKVEEGIQEFKQVAKEGSLWNLRKRNDEEIKMGLKKMQELEICIECIESGSEKVFRGLINSRVSLLNVLTQ